jgi:hypothetical protein
MTRSEFAIGACVCLLVALAAWATIPYVNSRIPERLSATAPTEPCFDKGGWQNWPWPNVPWLSPPCRPSAPKQS